MKHAIILISNDDAAAFSTAVAEHLANGAKLVGFSTAITRDDRVAYSALLTDEAPR